MGVAAGGRERPRVIVDEDIAEGVYAASGSPCCQAAARVEAGAAGGFAVVIEGGHLAGADHEALMEEATVCFDREARITAVPGGEAVAAGPARVLSARWGASVPSPGDFPVRRIEVETRSGRAPRVTAAFISDGAS